MYAQDTKTTNMSPVLRTMTNITPVPRVSVHERGLLRLDYANRTMYTVHQCTWGMAHRSSSRTQRHTHTRDTPNKTNHEPEPNAKSTGINSGKLRQPGNEPARLMAKFRPLHPLNALCSSALFPRVFCPFVFFFSFCVRSVGRPPTFPRARSAEKWLLDDQPLARVRT